MSHTYATSDLNSADRRRAAAVRMDSYSVLGLIIVAALPALFWTAFIGGVASGIGFPLGTVSLAIVALTILVFLAFIWAVLVRRQDRAEGSPS